MLPHRPPQAVDSRRPARDLIDAVLDNMRRNLEPLKYTTLAPSRYLVYVHPAEHSRLEGILPILRDQTVRALGETLESLNRPSALEHYAGRVWRRRQPRVEQAGDWHVEFLPDPDGTVAEGDILVDSELLLPDAPELGGGSRTRRLTTVKSGQHTTTRERSDPPPVPPELPAIFARITYDDSAGHHVFEVAKDSITVGRGGVTYPVDIKIESSVDVSREHARIRRDPATGGFFLIDLSSLGTTLNGRHVPSGFAELDGSKRENGVETPVPEIARIGLAETVFLDFTKVR
jgi:hypothetical protein